MSDWNERSLFQPPRPFCRGKPKNIYLYKYYDFPTVNQIHITNEPSRRASQYRKLKNSVNYRVIKNDHTKQSLISLLGVRNLISRCLHRMPANYISSIVYNQDHTSIGGYNTHDELISCITFKPFSYRDFAELVFCVVKPEEQVNGVGASLMDRFKGYIQAIGIHNVLVYADNTAIGFFERQGFTFEIPMPKKQYNGLIKEYNGATLMHCEVVNEFDYVNRYDLAEAMQKIIAASLDPPEQLTFSSFPVKEIKGIQIVTDVPVPLNDLIKTIYDKLIAEQFSNLFMKLVPKKLNPEYYQVIKNPMCFEKINKKIEKGKYENLQMFINDVQLIITNALNFNELESKYSKYATLLEKHFERVLKTFNIEYHDH